MSIETESDSKQIAIDSGSSRDFSSYSKKPSIIERIAMQIVLRALCDMGKGRLVLRLPNGDLVDNGGDDLSCVADIQVGNYSFFIRCIKFGAIGFAESYIDGEWETPDLTAVIGWFILNQENSTVMKGSSRQNPFIDLFNLINRGGHMLRPNSKRVSRKNISDHYDLSNSLFELFLDPSMTYSSALFKDGVDSLEEAQIRKYEKLCHSLVLEEGDRLLEIGCGWGGFACYAASNYGARVTGITISAAQYQYALRRVEEAGLQKLVEIKLVDYRDLEGEFDKIASIEMVEALGDTHVDQFFSQCSRLLSRDGLLAIQMITTPDCRYSELRDGVDFIQKHIFPGSLLLSIERVVKATAKTSDLHLVELTEFAESYARTLNIWSKNFERNLDRVRELGFSDKFIRKWFYYFAYCEAAFAMRQIGVVQLTMVRPNNRFLASRRLSTFESTSGVKEQ